MMNEFSIFTYRTKIVLLFICFCPLLNAQEVKEISINTQDTTSLKLSQIAESVTPISLNKKIDFLQFLHFTDQSIFACGATDIYQFTTSGEFIKKVDCGNRIQFITGNDDTKEIYVATSGKKIKCYDYSLNKKKEYKTKYTANSIFYLNKYIYLHSYMVLDVGIGYTISKINTVTGEEDELNDLNAYNLNSETKSAHGAISNANFFTYNNELFLAPSMDSVIYKIKENKITPYYNWKIKTRDGYYYYKPFVLSNKGIIGNYIYINYIIRNISDKYPNNRRCLYIKNLESGKIYNLNSKEDKNSHGTIFDDFYHTGYFDLMQLSNKPGYFYFIRQNNATNNRIDSLEQNPTLYIGRLKE